MDLFLTYAPLISLTIIAGLFVIALVNFSTVRKNMQKQSEQQIYSRMMDARLKLESTETFTKMAKESPIFAERFTVVDSPDEYYIIVAFLDLFEFLFGLNKRDMLDTEIWSRWKGLAKTIMTIPKFKRVWQKTKDVHASEFRDFIDSLDNNSNFCNDCYDCIYLFTKEDERRRRVEFYYDLIHKQETMESENFKDL